MIATARAERMKPKPSDRKAKNVSVGQIIPSQSPSKNATCCRRQGKERANIVGPERQLHSMVAVLACHNGNFSGCPDSSHLTFCMVVMPLVFSR